MYRPTLLAMTTSLALLYAVPAMAAPAKPAAAPSATVLAAGNPFAAPSTLPFQYPRFDRIKDEHFGPAFAAGIAQNLAEAEAIANNPRPPTFDNTIVALDRSGQLLARVSAVFYSLTATDANPALQALEMALSPKLAELNDTILLNPRLYQRVRQLYERRAALGLDAESLFLLERYHTDFVRAGARLASAERERLKALNAELAEVATAFAQNTLKEANASALVVDTRAELDGMSDSAIDAAAAAARERGLEGKFVIALTNSTLQAPMAVLRNRAVRERLQHASLARGSQGNAFDNRALVQRQARLRAERARLLGYPDYAAYALEDQTVKSAATVNRLLAELAAPAVANARAEARAIQQVIDAEQGGFAVADYDWAYYAGKVRKQRYDFDESQLRPYFELDSVLKNGVFYAATKLYGITFKERKDLPVHHPDARVFDVFDANGKPLAIFVADYYARPSKRGGAWMNQFVSQSRLLGTHPVVGNYLNVPKPAAGEPTLLTFDEVTTMFHEFGHALHGMFSDVKYPHFGGNSVPSDFGEFPSQVNEMWATWPEVLGNYARHYQSGAPIPRALLDKVLAAKKFNQGFATTEYLAASLLDQRWHQLQPDQVPDDVLAFEAAALKDAGGDFAPVPPRYRTTYFSHIFSGGYSAGYYSYLWSEKLDSDAVEWFKENGGLLRKNGQWFRDKLLSRGSSADGLDQYRAFRGRDAVIGPLLQRRGLSGAAQ